MLKTHPIFHLSAITILFGIAALSGSPGYAAQLRYVPSHVGKESSSSDRIERPQPDAFSKEIPVSTPLLRPAPRLQRSFLKPSTTAPGAKSSTSKNPFGESFQQERASSEFTGSRDRSSSDFLQEDKWVPRSRFERNSSEHTPEPREAVQSLQYSEAPYSSDERVLPPLISNADIKGENEQKIRKILEEGIALEKKRLWSDAMHHYDKALKKYSENESLRNRYREARFHHEIAKRYHDATFEHLLNNTSLSELLEMYGDVFARLHNDHVDCPQWKSLFQYGLEDLEIALSEEDFLKKNKIEAPSEKIVGLCRKMKSTAEPWTFRHIQDMKNGVLCIAELAQNEIGLNPAAVILEYICGAAFSQDSHTTYFTLRGLNDFNSMIEGRFVGIGVELDDEDVPLTILKVHPGSPAMQAGVRNGDRIVSVNATPTAEMSFEKAADLLQGEFGSTVVLNLQAPGESRVREVRIIRRDVEVASVEEVRMLDEELAYIRLTCFQPSSTDEMRAALHSLEKQGMRSLVLDLRRNPGGLLSIAVEIADLFIDSGVIVITQSRSDTSVWRAKNSRTWNIPLYVLIDEESASASEIFAGAIRDHKRGTLIGRQSYGKGTVQVIYRLTGSESMIPLSGLKLTVERFYSPEGKPFCGVGVLPDILPLEEPGVEEVVSYAKPGLPSDPSSILVQKIEESESPIAAEMKMKLRKPTARKRAIISSSPEDPFVAAAIFASKHRSSARMDPPRLSHTRP